MRLINQTFGSKFMKSADQILTNDVQIMIFCPSYIITTLSIINSRNIYKNLGKLSAKQRRSIWKYLIKFKSGNTFNKYQFVAVCERIGPHCVQPLKFCRHTEPPNEPPQHTKAQGNSVEKSAFSRYYVAHKIHKVSLIVVLQVLKSKKCNFALFLDSNHKISLEKSYMKLISPSGLNS